MSTEVNISAVDIGCRFKGSYSVSDEFVQLLVSLYKDVSTFNADQFASFGLEEIYAYLKGSHAYYIGDLMPTINEQMRAVEGQHKDSASIERLKQFVKAYRAELYEHIEIEEQVILKFVHDILDGNYDQGNRDFFFNHFLHTHNDEIISTLDEIRSAVEDSEDDIANDLKVKSLFETLNLLKRDLEIHNLIEDEVFVLKTLDFVNTNFPHQTV